MLEILLLRLKLIITFLRNKTIINISQEQGKKNIFLFLGADYGNLGDVAITYAQTKFLKNHYPSYNIVEIPISQTLSGIKSVKDIIEEGDIITLIGGGNTSDLYDDIEFLRQLVIWNFRKNKNIAFPQTFDFTNSLKGRFCKSIARFIYGKAENFTLMAREANTMQILKREFPKVSAVMMPDIVMTLDERNSSSRKGVLICLRSDKERIISNDYQQKIISQLTKMFDTIDYQDTQVDKVDSNNRYDKLNDIFDEFRSHELVITDRLHGMIISFITGTPALVIDNSNHKVSACYEWIKECGYIKMIQNADDVQSFEPIDNFEDTHKKILNQYDTLSCLQFL